MACAGNRFEPRARNRVPILLAANGWHDSIPRSPYDQGWIAHAADELRQGLVKHVRLVSDAAGHFAINFPSLELIKRGLRRVQLDVFVVVLESRAHVVNCVNEELIQNLAFPGLETHGIDQYQMRDGMMTHHGQLGGDPSAEAKSDHGDRSNIQFLQQRAINYRDVTNAP